MPSEPVRFFKGQRHRALKLLFDREGLGIWPGGETRRAAAADSKLYGFRVKLQIGQNLPTQAGFFGRHAEQHMSGANAVVTQAVRVNLGALQDPAKVLRVTVLFYHPSAIITA
jgi:hypothetical protein